MEKSLNDTEINEYTELSKSELESVNEENINTNNIISYNLDRNSELKTLNQKKFEYNADNSIEIKINDKEGLQDIIDKQNKIINRYKKHKENTKESLIEIENIHKSYLLGIEGVPALRGINLNIVKGEFLIIIGTSGGGKTTLLNCIGTIDKPSRGLLKIENKTILDTTKDQYLAKLRQDKIGFVFQSFNLINSFTALENVKLPMQIKGELSAKEINERAENLLEKFNLKNRMNSFPNQLSGGEQQRVTIARALSNNPSLLLLDEPTGDLDSKNTDIVLNYLIDLNKKENITIIMVTHEESLKNYANRIVNIQDGKIKSIFNNSIKKRNEEIEKLKNNVKNIENHKKENKNSNSTSYRLPSDYAYFKFIKNNL